MTVRRYLTPGVQFINCVILEYVGTDLDKYADFSPLYAAYDREKSVYFALPDSLYQPAGGCSSSHNSNDGF